jgi:hypothetical protein
MGFVMVLCILWSLWVVGIISTCIEKLDNINTFLQIEKLVQKRLNPLSLAFREGKDFFNGD